MSSHRQPLQARSRRTYDALLDATGQLLGEVGIERISANMICKRAGTTPPAFYRYFADKTAIVATLAERLMLRQNVALEAWVARHADATLDAMADGVVDLLRTMHTITAGEPGALWIMRALHAVPSLTPIRLASHHHVTDALTDLFARRLPHVERALLRRRVRLSVEIAYSIDEMLKEEDVDPEAVFADATPVFAAMFRYPDYALPGTDR